MIGKEKLHVWCLDPDREAASRKNQDNLKDKSSTGQSLAVAPSAFCASRSRSLMIATDRRKP
jgi:hypothetical protein